MTALAGPRRGYKPKTIIGYAKNLRTFAAWATSAGKTIMAQFDAELVKDYMHYLQHKPKWAQRTYTTKTEALVSASAIRNYVRDLETFASWLAGEHYSRGNPLATVRLPKADEPRIAPFTDEELALIFSALDTSDAFDLRDYVMLHTLWDTGMRAGELVELTLDHLDLKACQIRFEHAKWGKWRDIGFGHETHKYLTRYLSLCRPRARD